MDTVMLAAFIDELDKVASNAAFRGSSKNSVMGPAPVATGGKPSTSMKAVTKPTDYTVVHSQPPPMAQSTTQASKLVPPPLVRT